jgi:hypothetical protein
MVGFGRVIKQIHVKIGKSGNRSMRSYCKTWCPFYLCIWDKFRVVDDIDVFPRPEMTGKGSVEEDRVGERHSRDLYTAGDKD